MDSHTILWISTVVLGAGGLLLLLIGKHRTPAEGLQTVLHGTIPLMAACSYFAMAVGQGLVELPNGPGATRILYFARYIDWAFTTPLLLLSLGISGMHAGKKHAGLLTGAVLSDLLMIATAFCFSASEVAWIRWTWFIISCAAFLGVYYVIWGPQLRANTKERADIRSAYRSHATMLSVLWLIYPVALALSPDGLSVISDAAGVLSIAVLDVLSKVAFGLVCTSSDKSVTERDLQDTQAPQAASRQPATML